MVVGVEGGEGWGQGVEEGEVGGWSGDCGKGGVRRGRQVMGFGFERVCFGELEVLVGFIFDDYYVIFVVDGVDFFFVFD